MNGGGTSRVARGLIVCGTASVLLSGCLIGPLPGPSQPMPNAGQSAPGTAPPAPGSPAPASPGVQGRPVVPVPDVKPRGFTNPPAGSGLQRYTQQKLAWTKCGELECAITKVPLDYDDPDGQAITLTLSRRKATASPRLGALFINPGGPGGSGIEYVEGFRNKGLEGYDIVGWDPRGVGQSTPVVCFNTDELDAYLARDSSPDSDEEDRDLLDAEKAFGRSCLERSGRLLEHVSTQETVRDLDVLRQVVGDEKLHYFGSSYGTQIGSLYAEVFPQQVGRLVLDGAVNITDDKSVSQTQGFERSLGNFAAWCANRSCRLGNTKQAVLDRISAFWSELDSRPMRGGRRPLTQQLGVIGVLFVLYQNEDYWKYLLQALELAIYDDDPRYLLFLADQYHQRDEKNGTFGQSNFGFPGVRCLDSQDVNLDGVRKEAEADDTNAPVLGKVSGPDYVCPMWPVAPTPKPPTIDGEGAAPILVIGTTGDPATPYEYAERMAEQLDSGVLVSLEGEGHLAYGQSTCVQRIVVAYLVRGQVPQDGVRC
jgi:pimeloyl-ACP methyl ester carboxylesterase